MTNSGGGAGVPRWPGLDGLRGVAVLLVVGCHLGLPGFLSMSGQVGVTMFFTLSGFLITTLICDELERTGRVDLGGFYQRRARRLLPALYTLIGASVALSVAFRTNFVTPVQVIGAALYCSNFLTAAGLGSGLGGALHHTWSLVLEEQFYLLWPGALLLLRRRRRLLLWLLAGSCICGVCYRLHLWRIGDIQGLQYGTLARVDELMAGCLLAVAVRGRVLPPMSRLTTVAALVVCFLLELLPADEAYVMAYTVAAFASAVIILGELGGESRLLSWRPLMLVGRVSYGLYLWHHLALLVYFHTPGVHTWQSTTFWVLPPSVLLTALSWRYVEQPFLRRTRARRPSAEVSESCDDTMATASASVEAKGEGGLQIVL